jgi:alcohol dehydrogenase YqhD (iron-dependent ADH family)
MLNFYYDIPTKVYFGQGEVKHLGEAIKCYGSKVLLAYGGGSIKKNGLYDQVVDILKNEEISYVELSGIEPNPRITSVLEGVKLCHDHQVDFILAVGAGSVIDCCKIIAAGYYYDGNPWDYMIGKAKISQALPLGTILTLSATGSEMDTAAVISNLETEEKLGVLHDALCPKFSILDPTYTFTVNAYQTAAGTADIMSHVFEQYFSITKGDFLQARLAEAILKTCIHYGPIAIKEPDNYEARANLMWASSLALNRLLAYGHVTDWATHGMEHELSAFYDITHGVGLGILTPHWMSYVLNEQTLGKFAEYGKNVWDITEDDPKLVAEKAIAQTKAFFTEALGIPSTLEAVGIEETKLEAMAEQATRRGTLGSFKKLGTQDVLNIYKNAYR